MGLLKETMQAIIRVDANISTSIDLWRFESMKKDINRKNAVKEVPSERTIDLRFSYPENLDFKDRLSAVRLFTGLSDSEFGAAIGLSGSQIFEIGRGKLAPWATLYRAISRKYNIDETWLATGHLPQTTEEPAKPIENYQRVVTGNFMYGGDDLQKIRTMMGVVSPSESFPMGGHSGTDVDPTLQVLRETYLHQERDPNLAQDYVDRKHVERQGRCAQELDSSRIAPKLQ